MARRIFLVMRIAAIPLLMALIGVIEERHFPSWFRLLTFSLVFLILADAASLLRGGARDLALALASLVFGLCIVEAIANSVEHKQVVASTDGWSVQRPDIGWGPQHAGIFHSVRTNPATGATIYSADYTIDSHLLRQVRSVESGPTIVFFGDSVTFGLGVNDADTLPQIFADQLGQKQRVLNLAFTGYGPQQFLRELELGLFDQVIGSQPKLFVFMTAAWHAERTACKASWMMHAPRYELDKDSIRFVGSCYQGPSLWMREWIENSAAYRQFVEPYRHKVGRDDVELYVRVLLAAVTLAREKYGVPTLIPYLHVWEPYLAGTGFTNDLIVQRLRDGGAIVVDASLSQEEAAGAVISIPGDGHPTPLANRARASLLKTYLEQHMSGVLVSSLK